MSADNWRVCPKCLREAQAEKRRKRKHADEQYGKVEASEYVKLLAEAEKEIRLEETLREDYSIGISTDGTFRVDYQGSCSMCNFKFGFEYNADTLAIGGTQ